LKSALIGPSFIDPRKDSETNSSQEYPIATWERSVTHPFITLVIILIVLGFHPVVLRPAHEDGVQSLYMSRELHRGNAVRELRRLYPEPEDTKAFELRGALSR
jgi:hypothetical protein